MKPTIPEVVALFSNYLQLPGNEAWGSLHSVMEDGNIGDVDVQLCISSAHERGDEEGSNLGLILLSLSKTQRKRLPDAVRAYDAKTSAGEGQEKR